jgi:hypothetical protein
MRRVQIISRKDRVGNDPESSETIRQTCEACRMIWSDLRGDTESQAETSWPPMATRSAVTKVNGPKVFVCHSNISLSKNWPNAGKSENSLLPADCHRRVTMHEMRTIRRKGRIGNDSESSETIRQSLAQAQGRYSPDCMATCRGWQK